MAEMQRDPAEAKVRPHRGDGHRVRGALRREELAFAVGESVIARTIVRSVAILLLAACATETPPQPQWSKPGAGSEELSAARAECMNQAQEPDLGVDRSRMQAQARGNVSRQHSLTALDVQPSLSHPTTGRECLDRRPGTLQLADQVGNAERGRGLGDGGSAIARAARIGETPHPPDTASLALRARSSSSIVPRSFSRCRTILEWLQPRPKGQRPRRRGRP